MYQSSNFYNYGQPSYLSQADILSFQREVALKEAAARIALGVFKAKKDIEETSEETLAKKKADIRLAAECVDSSFAMNEDGSISRNQEFLLAPAQNYKSANFKVAVVHTLHPASGKKLTVLGLSIIPENRGRHEIFLDLKKGSASYYARKFREAGGRIKFKRGENNEVYLRFVEMLLQHANDYFIPDKLGFYEFEERWYYAGKGTLTWKEVIKLAD